MPLTPAEFLALADAPPTEVSLNGLGSVLVGQLTAGDRDEIEAHRKDGVIENFRARHLQKILVNQDGSKAYAEGDIPKLARIPESVWDVIYAASTEINGLGNKALEEAVGNS